MADEIQAKIEGVGTVTAQTLINSSLKAVITGTGTINGDLRYPGLYRFTQEGLAQAYHQYRGCGIYG